MKLTLCYSSHLSNERLNLLPRDLLDYYLHKSLDVLEVLVQKAVKVMLVEDQKVTVVYFFVALCVYYSTRLLSVKILTELVVLSLFIVPYRYAKHQKTVDTYLSLIQERMEIVVNVTKYHANYLIDQATAAHSLLQGVLDQLNSFIRAKREATTTTPEQQAPEETTNSTL